VRRPEVTPPPSGCAAHSGVGLVVWLKWTGRRLRCAKTIRSNKTRKVTVDAKKRSVEAEPRPHQLIQCGRVFW